jgi:hypothetical protein
MDTSYIPVDMETLPFYIASIGQLPAHQSAVRTAATLTNSQRAAHDTEPS